MKLQRLWGENGILRPNGIPKGAVTVYLPVGDECEIRDSTWQELDDILAKHNLELYIDHADTTVPIIAILPR